MSIQLIVPDVRAVTLPELVAAVSSAASGSVEPFGAEVVEFCAEFSRALSKSPETRPYPEIQALAFWMRRSELLRLRAEFEALATGNTVLVPRGLVFHIPPANVDTIFIYSWLLSLLAGNRNVVRLSTKQSPQADAICAVLNRVLASTASDRIRRGTLMVRYGYDASVTAALSGLADVRVIWGGDRTVTAVRAIALPAHARELTFPDRSSLCVLDSEQYLALDERGQDDLAERFFNDAFWFDQMGCSSPRAVVWCGGGDASARAGRTFFDRLARTVRARQHVIETGAVLSKLTFAFRAVLDQPVTAYETRSNEVSLLSLSDDAGLPQEHCGAGMFYQLRVERLEDLERLVSRREQTLTHFGFASDDLYRLAARLNGRGVDRMVPIGQALTFNRFWDGYDLLQEMTRRVHIEADRPPALRRAAAGA